EGAAGIAARATQPIRLWSRTHPGRASRLFADAVATREAIYSVFRAIADGETVREPDFAALTIAIGAAPSRHALVRAGGRYAWSVGDPKPSAAHMLAPVLWSAGDLILAADRRHIRRCANEECLWLFIDDSKGGTRRWCDMASCGNRAKARRHYAKVRQG